MEKIRELYHESKSDNDSLMFVNDIIMQFPTEKGYRVETFFSPKFVRVSVYKEEKVKIDDMLNYKLLYDQERVLKAIWRHINYYDGFHSLSDYGPDQITLNLKSNQYPEDFRIIREWIKK